MSNNLFQKWNPNWADNALNRSVQPIIWISSTGSVENCNEALSKMLSFSMKELRQMSLFDLDEDLSKKAWKNIWSGLLELKTDEVETTFQNKEGKYLAVNLSITLVEETGVQIAFVIVKDITQKNELKLHLEEANLLMERIVKERSDGSKMTLDALIQKKEAIDKLQELQRHHESILQSAGDGIYGLDCDGRTTFANDAAVRMVGYKLEDILGKSQHDLIHHTKEDGSVFDKKECSIYASFKDGKVHHVENEIFWRQDGSFFPVEYISTPIWNKDKKLTGAVVSFKDITRRKEAEQGLQNANVDLKQALSEVKHLKSRLELENKYLQQEIKLTHNFEEIISQSRLFKRVLKQVEQVAKTDATVLILGESGTGKELIARAVNNLSHRKDRTMVKVNCAALPATLIESELFGHEKGAFTGAIAKKVGRFELAHGGTLFLDEIGEFPIELQPKLLRVLQEGEFERLGSTTTQKVDVRIIAATNVNLEEAVGKGQFREDLFYRINVFPIQIPALRERKEDIALLTRHFLLKYNARFGKKIEILTQGVVDSLTQYDWPGNVRELENVIERGVIVSPKNKLEIGDVIPRTGGINSKEKIITLTDNERAHILKTLKQTNWRISGDKGAAKILNINRTTLEARMKKLDISRP